jgi:hypothetical protein
VAGSARRWAPDWDEEAVEWPALAAGARRHADRFRSEEWTWRR